MDATSRYEGASGDVLELPGEYAAPETLEFAQFLSDTARNLMEEANALQGLGLSEWDAARWLVRRNAFLLSQCTTATLQCSFSCHKASTSADG